MPGLRTLPLYGANGGLTGDFPSSAVVRSDHSPERPAKKDSDSDVIRVLVFLVLHGEPRGSERGDDALFQVLFPSRWKK